jgi:antagonist of KipI
LLSTVQDLGRRGAAWMGVSPSGAADGLSARMANRLLHNDDNAALLETTLSGISLELTCAARIAVTGADAPLIAAGQELPLWRAHALPAGTRLTIGAATLGVRNYLAFDGGIETPPVMGSCSTDVVSEFGGHLGRRLQRGDVFALKAPGDADEDMRLRDAAASRALTRLTPDMLSTLRDHVLHRPALLRVLPGPHAQRIAPRSRASLFGQAYRVSIHSNRQGLRLEGQPLAAGAAVELLSVGVCAGCVQLPNDGLPILLLSEHQTTGGYPIVLCVISADVARAAQLAPGDEMRFERTSYADAAKILV